MVHDQAWNLAAAPWFMKSFRLNFRGSVTVQEIHVPQSKHLSQPLGGGRVPGAGWCVISGQLGKSSQAKLTFFLVLLEPHWPREKPLLPAPPFLQVLRLPCVH